MLNSPYAKPPVSPSGLRPRLMLNRNDIERVKNNLSLYPSVTERWNELCASELAKVGATPDFGSYHLRDCLIIEARALKMLLEPDEAEIKQLISDLCEMLEGFHVKDGIMGARWGGHLIFIAAEVYDWCYDHLTDENKELIISFCEKTAEDYMEMGYPPSRQMAIAGHGGESQLLRDLLAFGIAVYDERPDIYDFCAGRIFDEYVSEYNLMFAAGASPQGPSYGAYRFTCMLWSELLMRPMLKAPLYESTETFADGFYYLRLPDGQALPLGDNFYATKSPNTRAYPFAVPMFLAWACTGRDDFFEEAEGVETYLVPERCGIDYYKDGSWGEALISPVSYLVFAGLTESKPGKKREKWHHFGDPIGMSVYKDEDTFVLMKLGNFWGSNHDHLDTGCFQIWYKGTLAGDSGIYDNYHAPHRRHYITRTCAHNCLTIRAPQHIEGSGYPADRPNDGGTRRPRGAEEPKTYAIFREFYHMADTLWHLESEDEVSICGDLSDAYNHTCDKVIRKMQYFPKEKRFVVSDEVVSKCADYKKEFLIHYELEPEISGNTVVLQNDRARLVCHVKTPEDATITNLGGEGKRFMCDGVNYDPPCFFDNKDLGWGRVVISPKSPSLTDNFVVEMTLEEKENRS